MVERKDIERVAALAKLDMGRETKRLTDDMQAIVEMVDRLLEIELSPGLCPPDTELFNTFREDIPKPSMQREKVLQNAPVVEAGCISVPKILGNRED
jgi:aspartyl-tRNA(Asn)/glutamyl-tRNA(Gln) amidotransferase subunit C